MKLPTIPKVFFLNANFKDPESEALKLTDSLIKKKRNEVTIYEDILQYATDVLNHSDSIVFGEDWVLGSVFSAGEHKSSMVSNMVGVFPVHSKTSLFIFAREITQVIYQRGFKDEIVELIVKRVLKKIPKMLSKNFKVKKIESNYIVTKK